MEYDTARLLILLGVPVAIAALKGVVPHLPKPVAPFLAPLLGALIEALGAVTLGEQPSPVAGAVLGSAGVGVREGYDQAKKGAKRGAKLTLVGLVALPALLLSACNNCKPPAPPPPATPTVEAYTAPQFVPKSGIHWPE